MKRVYVAGAYSATDVIKVLDNIREGMRASLEVFRAGFAPFCPWLDFHYQLMLRPGETLTVPDFYEYSIAWLEVSDAMYVHPNSDWRNSTGTLAEIKTAKECGIPIYYDLQKLIVGEGCDMSDPTYKKPIGDDAVQYTQLARVLHDAYGQAANGKGRERHADNEAFESQQICVINRWLRGNPVAGPIFQVVKKAVETTKLSPKDAIRELYGAINYAAAAIILLEEIAEAEKTSDFSHSFDRSRSSAATQQCTKVFAAGEKEGG